MGICSSYSLALLRSVFCVPSESVSVFVHPIVCACVLCVRVSACVRVYACVSVVSAPDPTDAAADGLHHRYASVLTRSGDVIHPQLRPLGLGPRLV